MTRKRKGMVIKNTDIRSVSVALETRVLDIGPGEEMPITSEEVRDPALREKLQARAISIVRPISEAEEVVVRRSLEEFSNGDQ